MYASLLSLLLPGIIEILKRVIPDPAAQAEAEKSVTALLLENQAAIVTAAKDVMVADSASGDAYTSRARPTVVYWSLGAISLIAVLAIFGGAAPVLGAFQQVPDKLWDLMTYGIGAYMLGRSGEKMLSPIVEQFISKKK